jgi:hypothetical protein
MFRLHDNTRRQICVAAFMGLCVLPTLGVSGWTIARRLPWNRQAEEARLSAELGVAVSMESMAHTLPGVVRYTGLKLTDPETGLELLHCGAVEATWTSMTDSRGQTRPAIALAARQIESTAGAWERLDDMLRRRLECQSGQPEIEFRLTADQWTLRDGNESQACHDVEGGIGLVPNGIEALLAFRLLGAASPAPVQMGVSRNRLIVPPANEFDLDTGPSFVSCRLFAACSKEIQALGPNCRFSGKVWMFRSSGGWSGELSGQLLDADVGSLARDGIAPDVHGTADVRLEKVRFEQGRIDEMTNCIVTARDGRVLGKLAAYSAGQPGGWQARLLPVSEESRK